jgi:hypothetical protein
MHRPSALLKPSTMLIPDASPESITARLSSRKLVSASSHRLSSLLLPSQPTSSQSLLFRHAILQILKPQIAEDQCVDLDGIIFRTTGNIVVDHADPELLTISNL